MESEARAVKEHKGELTPYKRNLLLTYDQPTTNVEHGLHLENTLQDINRPFMKNVTHLHWWQLSFLQTISKILLNGQGFV
jgi:hypothetical protein